MNVFVVGCGRVGSRLATYLSSEGHDVVVIDKDPSSFARLGPAFNGITHVGYGFDEELLARAGIERCDAFAAVTDLDNTNMMASEVASKIFNVPRVVARLYDPDRERTMQQLGLDFVTGTELVAQSILDRLVKGHGHHLTTRGGLELIEFKAGPKAHDKRVIDIQIPNQFRVCLVTREGTSFIPWRDSLLKRYDILLAVVQDIAYGKVRQFMENPDVHRD